MKTQIAGTRNDFLYQTLTLSITQAENSAKEKGEKIYLIVMSTWMYEVISEHLKSAFSDNAFYKYLHNDKAKRIMGYQVALVEDLGYNEPVKFIMGKGE